jgi:hypothetical protein
VVLRPWISPGLPLSEYGGGQNVVVRGFYLWGNPRGGFPPENSALRRKKAVNKNVHVKTRRDGLPCPGEHFILIKQTRFVPKKYVDFSMT